MLATIIVSFIIFLCCVAVVYDMYKKKKQGRGSCSCGCSGCPMAGSCESKKD